MAHERNDSCNRRQSISTQNVRPGNLELGAGNSKPCLFLRFAAIPGVICGHKALSGIKRSGGTLAGQGLATAGLITGYIAIALGILVLPSAIPNFIKARQTTQQNACMNNLRRNKAAKQRWAMENIVIRINNGYSALG